MCSQPASWISENEMTSSASMASMASMAPWLHVELRIVHQGSRMFSNVLDPEGQWGPQLTIYISLSHFANVSQFCRQRHPELALCLLLKTSIYHRGLDTQHIKISRSILFNFDKLGLGQDIEGGETIDWATAEAMSFASLLLEGNHVRITGALVTKGYVKLAATSVTQDCH